ncbi:MAG TPA: LiaF domain-containing protein [Ktedonobacterales bacterium]|nr:LiaF domain-containing protein [Ktedonobacterales bacterium]
MGQQPALTPQQEAIQVVRTRYEQGILTFEQFEAAINSLLLAQTPEECQRVIDGLPSTTVTHALHAPTPTPTPETATSATYHTATSPTYHMVGTVGELKRLQHPWRLEPRTSVRLWLGQVKLDLSLATLPPHGVLEVFVPVGEIVIYVPREAHVTLRAFALVGEVKALGEERNGVFARLAEEDFPPEATPAVSAPHLEIRLNTLFGSVKVIRVNGPALALKDMIKEVAGQVLLATLDAFRQNRKGKTSSN